MKVKMTGMTKVIDMSGGAKAGDGGNQDMGTSNRESDEPEIPESEDADDGSDIEPVPIPPPNRPPDLVDKDVDEDGWNRWSGDFDGFLDGMRSARVVHGEGSTYFDMLFQSGQSDSYGDGYRNGFERGYDSEVEMIITDRAFDKMFGLD